MGKGNNKKRMKKYKKKYYTGGRIDMSKGGRVSLQKGGNPPKYGDYRINEEGVREQFSPVGWNPTKEQPKPVVKKPIEQEPQKPIQVGGNEPIDAIGEPVRNPNLSGPRRGADEPIDVIGAGGGPNFNKPPASSTGSNMLPPMSVGGTGGGNVQPTITDIDDGRRDSRDTRDGRGYEDDYGDGVGSGQTPPGGGTSDQGTPPLTPPVTPPTQTQTSTTAKEKAEQLIQQDTTIPTPKEVEVGDLGVAKAMEERQPITAKEAEVGVAPEAQIMEDVSTAQTPEELQAAKMEAEQIAKTPEIEVTKGEVVEDALAKAAKVDRVEPIEGVEVEIPEGALTERVVGTISEGAKATAAINAGTSLSRITRAKKQLSRAGLSDTDIEEIGNDPEALEDRLADFSEEQRGIIEGLPEEALVSTQINGLLEGIENGEIPVWARPAVAQVEQMLAKRGMSASTVGRDALLNTIIQSAMPIAQSNAQAIQNSVAQQRDIEFRESEANAQRVQQTALTNAQNVFNMDMAQFNADQQVALSNSKFLQTVGLTEANFNQQATIQLSLIHI